MFDYSMRIILSGMVVLKFGVKTILKKVIVNLQFSLKL